MVLIEATTFATSVCNANRWRTHFDRTKRVAQLISFNRHPEISQFEHRRRFEETCRLWDRSVLNVRGCLEKASYSRGSSWSR